MKNFLKKYFPNSLIDHIENNLYLVVLPSYFNRGNNELEIKINLMLLKIWEEEYWDLWQKEDDLTHLDDVERKDFGRYDFNDDDHLRIIKNRLRNIITMPRCKDAVRLIGIKVGEEFYTFKIDEI